MVGAAGSQSDPAGFDRYPLDPQHFDEAVDEGGAPRPTYAAVAEALARQDLGELAERVRAATAALDLTFGPGKPVTVDPVPRVIGAAEWEWLQAGLMQRARALNAFLADAYGGQRIFDADVVPRRLLDTSPGYEPRMRGLLAADFPAATVAGFDLVRDASGALLVLEDNLRMPSGSSYAKALRAVVEPALRASARPRPLAGFAEALGEALAAAGEDGLATAAIVTDGPDSGAAFEHRDIAAALGIPILTPGDLETARGRLFARIGRERRQLEVVYRRMDADRLSDPDGSPTAIGELMLPALESGRLRCLNAFGTGLADDKLAHAYVERMIDFYLGEEPSLPSVPTLDLSDETDRENAMDRLEQLVIKPRDGFGGHGVTIMPRATESQRRRAIGLVRRAPARFVAQEVLPLSTHPTVAGGRLRPRHVDLRPFVVSSGAGATTMPGGLTRFAPAEGEMIVNSSQGGGCKDTWVLEPQAGDRR
jgi:uncharacterized circularly permuted ATP-grasp superfamily protein